MTRSHTQSLKIQLEEALQMLKLVAAEERTCVEVREWLELNYPEDAEQSSKSIFNLLMKNGQRDE